MYQPTFDQVEQLSEQGNLIPIYRELPADLETPVSVYLKLQDEGPSFLLESVSGGERVARYSFVGVRPRALLSAAGASAFMGRMATSAACLDWRPGSAGSPQGPHGSPSSPRKRLVDLPRFSGGAVGFLAYDAVRRFERLPARRPMGWDRQKPPLCWPIPWSPLTMPANAC
jgi:anthranilate synthase component 1